MKLWEYIKRHRMVLAFLLVAAAASYANIKAFEASDTAVQASKASIALTKQVEREGTERRSQLCRPAELEYHDRVRSLKVTYQYVMDLPPEERYTTLNKVFLTEIPRAEREVKIQMPPEFCAEPGNGLEAKNPRVPERPEKVDKIIKEMPQD